ncbi:MAG: transporter substrate-binding domain-containing protein [Clostridia bacterium]|nr:transporter substrate-binding domain-containing protein [Clostridia bacterium]
MKKVIALILAVLMMGVLFVGCSSGGSKSDSEGDAQQEEEATVEEQAGVVLNSAADLVGKKIAVQEGTTGDLIASDIADAEIVRFKKATDAAMELKNGRVDCVIIDEMPAKKIVERNDDMVILDFQPTDEIEKYAIAVKKDNAELLGIVNDTIAEIQENGAYDSIFAYYITGDEEAVLPEIPEYEADGEIIMGTNAEFEPFEFRDDANEIAGFDVEVAKWVAYKAGKTLRIEDMNFDSLIAALSSGKIDFIAAGMTNTEERRQNVDFSTDYYESNQAIIVLK